MKSKSTERFDAPKPTPGRGIIDTFRDANEVRQRKANVAGVHPSQVAPPAAPKPTMPASKLGIIEQARIAAEERAKRGG